MPTHRLPSLRPLAILAGLTGVLLLFGAVALGALSAAATVDTSRVDADLEVERRLHDELQADLAELEDPARVAAYAADALNLVEPPEVVIVPLAPAGTLPAPAGGSPAEAESR